MKTTTAFFSAMMALPLALSASTPSESMAEAQKKAAKEKKDLLLIMTASKWHPSSQKFDKEVLQSEAFKKGTEKDFIEVVFDFPQKRADAHTDLLELQQKYRFRTMPALILADAAGRPYAYTGATSNNPESFLESLAELHKVGDESARLFSEGRKAKGMNQAKMLVKGLELLPQDMIRDFYAPELTLIAQADQEGKTGYVAKIEKAEALRKEQALFDKLFADRNFDEIIKRAKEAGAKKKGEDGQRLKLYLIRALTEKKDFKGATKEVEAMKQLDPKSEFGQQSERYLSYIKSAEARDKQMKEMAKNPKKAEPKKPRQPIVSKPVAIVNDIEELKKEALASEQALAKAIAQEEELKKNGSGVSKKIAALEAELKKLREVGKEEIEAMKKAVAEREKFARQAKAMKEVIENHEAMEKRKRDIAELEKRATQLQKQAEVLRKKADAIKKGK